MVPLAALVLRAAMGLGAAGLRRLAGPAARARGPAAQLRRRRWPPPSPCLWACCWPGCWCGCASPGAGCSKPGRSAIRPANGGGRHHADHAVRTERPARRAARRRLGIKVAYTPLGILIALVFVGHPLRRAHHRTGVARPAARDGGGRGDPGCSASADAAARGAAGAAAGALVSFGLAFARGVGEYG